MLAMGDILAFASHVFTADSSPTESIRLVRTVASRFPKTLIICTDTSSLPPAVVTRFVAVRVNPRQPDWICTRAVSAFDRPRTRSQSDRASVSERPYRRLSCGIVHSSFAPHGHPTGGPQRVPSCCIQNIHIAKQGDWTTMRHGIGLSRLPLCVSKCCTKIVGIPAPDGGQ